MPFRLLDLIIGMPSMEARDLEKKIREERSRYLVAELICKVYIYIYLTDIVNIIISSSFKVLM